MIKHHPVACRDSAVHRLLVMLKAGPMRRADIIKAGIKPGEYRDALRTLRSKGWGDCAVSLTTAGRDALAGLEKLEYDSSTDRKVAARRAKAKPKYADPAQAAAEARAMAGVRWP